MSRKKPVLPEYYSPEFTEKESKFIDEYLLSMNATEAARRAGYAESTAHSHASLWVCKNRMDCLPNKRHIWDAVTQAKANRSRLANIDALFVLTRLGEMTEADPLDIIDEDTGTYKEIHNWPPVWRKMLSAADVQEIYGPTVDGKKSSTGRIVKYKFIDKLKAYELMGKHVDVQAFKDKVEHEGSITITIDGDDSGL